jgi:hypothetical protein
LFVLPHHTTAGFALTAKEEEGVRAEDDDLGTTRKAT